MATSSAAELDSPPPSGTAVHTTASKDCIVPKGQKDKMKMVHLLQNLYKLLKFACCIENCQHWGLVKINMILLILT